MNQVQQHTTTQVSTPGPLAKYTLGPIHVAVWGNTDPNGNTYHSVKVERRYKDKAGDYQSTNSFRPSELPVVADLVGRAEMFIAKLNQPG